MLFELGAYRLFHKDPLVAWRFLRLWMPAAVRALAPNAGYGVSRMPVTGGAVLAANHLSALDPPAIGVYSTRAIRYMTKAELLRVPIAGEFMRMAGTFGVRRGEGDRDSLRVHRDLSDAARDWQRADRDSGRLFRGTRLAAARDWAAARAQTP